MAGLKTFTKSWTARLALWACGVFAASAIFVAGEFLAIRAFIPGVLNSFSGGLNVSEEFRQQEEFRILGHTVWMFGLPFLFTGLIAVYLFPAKLLPDAIDAFRKTEDELNGYPLALKSNQEQSKGDA